jgi:hypothetical protein
MFATVVERDEKELQQGQVVVELCEGSQVREDLFRAVYTMAESEVYFEPYFQVNCIWTLLTIIEVGIGCLNPYTTGWLVVFKSRISGLAVCYCYAWPPGLHIKWLI